MTVEVLFSVILWRLSEQPVSGDGVRNLPQAGSPAKSKIVSASFLHDLQRGEHVRVVLEFVEDLPAVHQTGAKKPIGPAALELGGIDTRVFRKCLFEVQRVVQERPDLAEVPFEPGRIGILVSEADAERLIKRPQGELARGAGYAAGGGLD